jgi:gas vesicle structural protein
VIVERTSPASSQVEVLDRVLDKGIVIDAWLRVALMGIDLITVQALVVVASIQTYLVSSEALARAGFASPIEGRTNAVTSTNAHPRQWQQVLRKR